MVTEPNAMLHIAKLKAYWLGLIEFRHSFTSHPMHKGIDLIDWYDRGREFAHVITLHHWEQ